MDWRILSSTFVLVFLAEIGDKTQLATFSIAGGTGSRWSVFLGSALALIAASALAVLLGDALARLVPPVWIRRASGAAFLAGGVFLLASRGD